MTDREPEESAWVWTGAGRRDCEPHRARRLGLLATVSAYLGVAALCLPGLPALLGLPLAAAAWELAGRDLEEMRAGLRDPSGRGATWDARQVALASMVVNGGALLIGVLFWASHLPA
jgi:hypothetical protein